MLDHEQPFVVFRFAFGFGVYVGTLGRETRTSNDHHDDVRGHFLLVPERQNNKKDMHAKNAQLQGRTAVVETRVRNKMTGCFFAQKCKIKEKPLALFMVPKSGPSKFYLNATKKRKVLNSRFELNPDQ